MNHAEESIWFKFARAVLVWLIATVLFCVLFVAAEFVGTLITQPKSVGGDAVALASLGFLPYLAVVALIYFIISLWTVFSIWFTDNFARQRKRVFIVTISCGIVLGIGFAIVARMIFGPAHG